MKNAFKKIFGVKVKHRSQGPKGTGGVLQGRPVNSIGAKNMALVPDKLVRGKNGNFKLGDLAKFTNNTTKSKAPVAKRQRDEKQPI